MQLRKLSELKKLPNNPRTISEQDFQRLLDSISKFGVLEARPLILSDRTGELVIIGGNQRYEACKRLGIEEVPTELISGLSEDDEREIVIRDNISNGDWDMGILACEWDDLPLNDWGIDIPDFDNAGDDSEHVEKEIDIGSEKFTHTCPMCKFEFND